MLDRKTRAKFEDMVEETIEKLMPQSYERLGGLNCTAYVTSEPVPFAQRESGVKKELQEGDKWAEEVFDCAWMHITGDVPAGLSGEELIFLINCGGEGLICDKDGVEKQAITCYASDFDWSLGKPEKKVVISDGLVQDGKADFWIDAAANDLFGKMKEDSRLAILCAAKLHGEIRALAYDAEILFGLYQINENGEWENAILEVLAGLSENWENISDAEAVRQRAVLAPYLAQKNDGDAFTYSAVGHAHLDLAWLWPIRESKRKGARTFITQLMNIDRYPCYIFGASQAQLYEWVKDCYPRVYEKVCAKIAEGKSWDVQGATWVEMDSNLIGGESMIRQFFYGKQYFLKEFGQEMKIFWVPDSFGYSACIPQVMKLANVPYFLTQKMSWNTVNKFPYHSFYWQGLDGSTVLAHMLPEDTYNGPVRADRMVFGAENYQEREISNQAMMLFGIGDGGAGPGFEHLERMQRLADLKGLPKVQPAKAMDFFERYDDGVTPYPTHKGELYLERHRGTYTTQSKNKKYNRKCEFALRNYEVALAFSSDTNPPIDRAALDTLWKEVLLYQFHDILPGSSINRVYVESVERYESILAELQAATTTLLAGMTAGKSAVNLTSYACEIPVENDGKWVKVAVPALGSAALAQGEILTRFAAKADGNTIENDKVSVTFTDGCITSLFDKALAREFVPAGEKMALLTEYADEGDCWDIRPYDYFAKERKDAVCTAFECGVNGAEAWALVTSKVGESVVTQRFSLLDGSAQLACEMTADCHQKDAMLRIAFPTTVQSEECNFNIQFGHLARRTTENNSVEQAQFEVSGQKFVDLSQDDCGISLLNDCKYGYRCKGSVLDMDLIRSPKGGPGENVDQGIHTIRYALLPHAGALSAETYRAAYLFNNPIQLVDGTASCGCEGGLFSSDNENLVLESIKIPEDGNGLIVRFYNASADAIQASAALAGYKMAESVDIMENTLAAKTDGVLSLHGFALTLVRFVK